MTVLLSRAETSLRFSLVYFFQLRSLLFVESHNADALRELLQQYLQRQNLIHLPSDRDLVSFAESIVCDDATARTESDQDVSLQLLRRPSALGQPIF